MRIYAIADMHGRYDLWTKAIEIIQEHSLFDSFPSKIIVMGDFVDRGPQSCQLIESLRSFENTDALELIVLRGNHEDMMIEVLGNYTYSNANWWNGNGGWRTMQSYGYEDGLFNANQPMKEPLADHLNWMKKLPLFYEDDLRVFVHAGVLPNMPMAEQPPQILTWHCWDKNWQFPWKDEEGGVHKESSYPKHVVHGHEQWAKGPILLETRTDLDTFAWYTGRLAIGVFDDTQSAPIEILWAEGEPHKY